VFLEAYRKLEKRVQGSFVFAEFVYYTLLYEQQEGKGSGVIGRVRTGGLDGDGRFVGLLL